MDISTKHLNVTILYDDKFAKVKKYTLKNDKQSLIIYYNSRLHCLLTIRANNVLYNMQVLILIFTKL